MSGKFIAVLKLLAVLAVSLSLDLGRALAQTPASCPVKLPENTRCFEGKDDKGAFYWIAIPERWNGALVVHAHGGPGLKPMTRAMPIPDLDRFKLLVWDGFAWVGSSYRRPGFAVRVAAEDVDNSRRIFWKAFGRPQYTLLHGQSWGGMVASKAADLYAAGAERPYDAVILTNGVVAGSARAYDFRVDLRVVYQYYCRNLPRSQDPIYPLWQGLAVDDPISFDEVAARVDACTGVRQPRERRTSGQQARLKEILAVTRVPEETLIGHMNWATAIFRDITTRHLSGGNPFSNRGVIYRGSRDDASLNAGVVRFDADPDAFDRFTEDIRISGHLAVPTLTLHGVGDPTVYVENEAAFAQHVDVAGSAEKLLQLYTDESNHSQLALPEYAALFNGALNWAKTGKRPAVSDMVSWCEAARKRWGEACHYLPGYIPPPLEARMYPRPPS